MADTPAIVIAALSGRSLAAAARRAGYRVLVADLFRDLDTRRLADRSVQVAGDLNGGITREALDAALEALLSRETRKPIGWAYGAGLEDRPELISRIGERIPVLGNQTGQVTSVKNPSQFFTLLDDLSIPHPEVSFVAPQNARGWLIKRAAASGGAHIRGMGSHDDRSGGCYFQRRSKGRPVSTLFLANGASAVTLGFSEQWTSPAGPRSPFRFGGAVQPARLTDAFRDAMTEVTRKVATAVGLRGLNSADFLVRERGFDLLEINPRPGASLDIHDLNHDAPLFELHCRAVADQLPADWRHSPQAAACSVVYARRRIVVPDAYRWPRWSADRPAPLTKIGPGEPVCTVLARGGTADDARRKVLRRGTDILAALEAIRPVCSDERTNDAGIQVGP